MNRRSFLSASLMAGGLIAVPRFGRWYRQGSGLLVREEGFLPTESMEVQGFVAGELDFTGFYKDGFSLCLRDETQERHIRYKDIGADGLLVVGDRSLLVRPFG